MPFTVTFRPDSGKSCRSFGVSLRGGTEQEAATAMTDTSLRIAVIVDPGLPLGLMANTVATISVGIGAAKTRFGNTELVDAAGRSVRNSADRPVPILQATSDVMVALLLKAMPVPEGGVIVPFPRFARSLHSFADYQAQFPSRDLATEVLDGLGLAGPEKWVKSLTGSLKLLR